MSPQPERIDLKNLTSWEVFRQALDTAAQYAADVDRRARYPLEAMGALRQSGALGWAVPRDWGGAGAGLADLSNATFELSRRCASTGMIFAMHQIQVACIARHCGNSPWFESYLRHLVPSPRLIASATSEVGVGGDIRRSLAPLSPADDCCGPRLRFQKRASTISYGAYADDLLTTLRRSPEADPGDQVLVLTHSQDTAFDQSSQWDTLGMRGTCSPAFVVRAVCSPDQVLAAPFSTIAAETMVPYSHILWSHVWLGLATDAFSRAQKFVREQARENPGTTPPSAFRLSELSAGMARFRALVQSALDEYTAHAEGTNRVNLSTIGYAVRINNLKIAASEAAAEVCGRALRICGMLGYKNDGPYSVGRHLRDAHSAALMVSNDRLHATNAALLLVHREGK